MPSEIRIDGIKLSKKVEEGLRREGVDERFIFALEVAMFNSGVDPYAQSYAHGVERAWEMYGVEGVRCNQVLMMNNMGKWKGEQARETKKLLKKWKEKK